MPIKVGKKGLAEVSLTIPQGASFAFPIVHKDAAGEIVDHSESTIRMAFQNMAGKTYDMSEHCVGGSENVTISIPPSVTAALPRGEMFWDIFAEMANGTSVRLAYGFVSIIDTYALDGE